FIDTSKLKQRSTTLGDALGTELGIHSNQYGGGASTPIIRGQEGKRIKVLQNNADVLDMSNMSPDHAVTVEPSLAKSIEIIRGASTLLYSSNSAAGVVNVIDYKIPTQMPQDGLEGNTT
ncbi:TonB-dependent receptor plug domain-containing protein, partial [Acinetobacter baumannii]